MNNVTPSGTSPHSSVPFAATEEQLTDILESIGEGFFACDAEWRFVYVNAQAEQILGIRAEEVIGQCHWEVFPLTLGTRLEDEYRRAAAGEPRDFENFYEPWGRWFHNRCFPCAGGGMVVYFQDITERKQHEANELQLRSILSEAQKIAHLGSFEYIVDSGDIVWSEEEFSIYGLDPAGPPPKFEEMLSRCIHPEDTELLKQAVVEFLANASIYELEHRIVRPDGSVRWVYNKAHPYFDANGKLIRYIGTTLDITERKRLEVEIKQLNTNLEEKIAERTRDLSASKERFRALVETISDCIWETDHQGRFTYLSPRFKDITGYPAETFLGKTPNDLLPVADLEQAGRLVSDTLADQQPIRLLEYPVRHNDGRKVIVEVSGIPYFDSEGNLLGIRGVTRDITARKRIEKEREQYALLCNTSADLMSIFDTTADRFIQVNPAFCEITGYSESELLATPLVQLVHPDDWEKTLALTHDSSLHDCVSSFENRYICKDGTIRWLSWQSFWDRKAGLVYATARDVTQRIQHEQELTAARQEAEEANLAKSRFLSIMSHEIRTPMNGLIGLIQLLLKTELTAQQRTLASNAINAGKELVQLLNSILDLSKIESNRMETECSNFGLRHTLEEAISLMEAAARDKGLQVSLSIPEEVPDLVQGDSGILRQVLVNLLSNAIKFTHTGEITISVGLVAEDQHQAKLQFEVRDTGIGLSADNLTRIFEPFTQADSSTTRQYGGTGLGLTICKRLVELMGGDIWVESTEGCGSTFRFSLVISKQQAESDLLQNSVSSGDESAGYGNGRRILLAEDDQRSRQIVQEMLEMYGWQVDTADNGTKVVQTMYRHEYDLILMDCMMPGMDGYEATRIIRDPSSAVRQHDIPIIALTGNTMREDVKQCLETGMNDHLQKPLFIDDLLKMLKKWCDKSTLQN